MEGDTQYIYKGTERMNTNSTVVISSFNRVPKRTEDQFVELIGELFQEFPKRALDWCFLHSKSHMYQLLCETPSSLLQQLFNWADSPEGGIFWTEIFETLKEL